MTAGLSAPAARSTSAPTPSGGGFIPELHGLRGVALAMVVVFHLFGRGRVSGGIDVFLVLSGFLATASLARRLRQGGRFEYARHVARVATRLVPAAALVLAATVAGALLLLPQNRWSGVADQAAASAWYWQNWYLIRFAFDYGAAGVAASPLQHFWSLSVQGQFYLLWPLVLLAAARVGGPARVGRRLFITSAALSLASFAFAVRLGATDQSVSYLHSLTRWWELGAGALLALALRRLALPSALRAVVGWGGLALVLTSGIVFDGAESFPGPAALWPVLGTLAVLLASGATGGTGWSPSRLLTGRALHWLGDISYPLYLWHWPLLVYYLAARDRPGVGLGGSLVVAVASVLLAWGTQRWLVDPLLARRDAFTPRRVALHVGVPLLVGGLLLIAGARYLDARADADLARAAESSAEHPGAAVIAADGTVGQGAFADPPAPAPASADRDKPRHYRKEGCVQSARGATEVLVCEWVASDNAERTVVVTGASHVDQWLPAIEAVARTRSRRLYLVIKLGCPFVGAEPGPGITPAEYSPSCLEWNRGAEDVIRGLHPDAVITRGTRTHGADPETAETAAEPVWKRLAADGVTVLALRDTPRFLDAPTTCLQSVGDATACGRSRASVYLETAPFAGELPERVVRIDPSGVVCPGSWCPAVIGNVLVYRDAEHLTASYAGTAASHLLRLIGDAAPWLL